MLADKQIPSISRRLFFKSVPHLDELRVLRVQWISDKVFNTLQCVFILFFLFPCSDFFEFLKYAVDDLIFC